MNTITLGKKEQTFPVKTIPAILGMGKATLILGDPKDEKGKYFYPRRRRPSVIGLAKMDIPAPKSDHDSVALAVSTDPKRPETLHHVHNDNGSLVAADGFRLHVIHDTPEKECAWCKEHPSDPFPNWQCLFPKSAKYTVDADAAELKSAFILAGVFSREGSQVAIMQAAETLEIIGRSEEFGESRNIVNCTSTGKGMRVGIRWQFARDAIHHVAPKGGMVTICLTSPTSPIVFKAGSREALVMPMHLG